MTDKIKGMLEDGFAQHEARMKELSATHLRRETCASPSPEDSLPLRQKMEELGGSVDEIERVRRGVNDVVAQTPSLVARQDSLCGSPNSTRFQKGSSRVQMEEVVAAMQVAPSSPFLDDQARHPFIAKVSLLTSDMRFEYTSGLLIALNLILIVVDADLLIKGTATPRWCERAAVTFIILFIVEFGLRALALGPRLRYGNDTDRKWFLFDALVLVTVGLDELMVRLASVSVNMAVLRTLRSFRFLRILRILRTVSFFTELRVMICGIQGSLVSLAWCLSLLSLIMVTVGVIMIQMLAEALKAGLDLEQSMFINDHFGSMLITVYTLLMAITGGLDWGDIFLPLRSIDAVATLFFLLYVAMGLFCILNVITGLYVDKAMNIMRSDRTAIELSVTSKRTRNVRMLQDIFRQGSSDLNPMIRCADFVRHCHDPTVQSCLRRVGCEVDETSAEEVFNCLDDGGKGVLSLSELIVGVTNISGPAQQLTVARMDYRLQLALAQCLGPDDLLIKTGDMVMV
eukprot:NODE_4590_length_1872_cov_6.374785.p1 GENE.NODE_4590_length_1872_cov_6.374785~~NODE_4590_length_1872_cov_6.374785.p1  ORF type:complete len:569 (-),score=71.05 NODE_4590_length_1872_cov_6.374785:165-1706(-)